MASVVPGRGSEAVAAPAVTPHQLLTQPTRLAAFRSKKTSPAAHPCPLTRRSSNVLNVAGMN